MKIDEVQIGGEYWCYVSGVRVKVKVEALVEPSGSFSKRRRFKVSRVNNGKILDKPRDPSALHPIGLTTAQARHNE